MSEFADYSEIDPTINDWALRNGIKFDREYKGYDVRSFWIHDQSGGKKVQVWIDEPDKDGFEIVHAAELDQHAESKWARKLERKTIVSELATCLDEVLATGLYWTKGATAKQVHTELWISWASLLRSYAAVHGLNSNNFAVIEFGADEIILRFGSRWTRFTHNQQQNSDGAQSAFALNEDGTVTLDGKIDEMDFAAERVTRELMQ